MKNLKPFDQFAKGKLSEEKKNKPAKIMRSKITIRSWLTSVEHESAKTDERIEFNNMLVFVNKSREKISFIIVFSVDRFSRSGANAIYIAEQLKQKGINLVSVMEKGRFSPL